MVVASTGRWVSHLSPLSSTPKNQIKRRSGRTARTKRLPQLGEWIVAATSAKQYPNELTATFRLPQATSFVVASSGVISSQVAASFSNIPNFSARFGSTFEECRIIKVEFKISALSPGCPGVSAFYLTTSNTAPTLALAQDRVEKLLENNSNNSRCQSKLCFKPKTFENLTWTPIGSSAPTPCYLSIYTDPSDYGSSSDNDPATAFIIEPFLTVQFRGATV
jgi:hypothetical protein